jgi:hypothetical protein
MYNCQVAPVPNTFSSAATPEEHLNDTPPRARSVYFHAPITPASIAVHGQHQHGKIQSTQGGTGMQAHPFSPIETGMPLLSFMRAAETLGSELPELGGCYRWGVGSYAYRPAACSQAQHHHSHDNIHWTPPKNQQLQLSIYTQSTMAPTDLPANAHVSAHPCLQAKLSQLRSASTGPRDAQSLVHEIALMVGYEALGAGLSTQQDGEVR